VPFHVVSGVCAHVCLFGSCVCCGNVRLCLEHLRCWSMLSAWLGWWSDCCLLLRRLFAVYVSVRTCDCVSVRAYVYSVQWGAQRRERTKVKLLFKRISGPQSVCCMGKHPTTHTHTHRQHTFHGQTTPSPDKYQQVQNTPKV